MQYTYVYVFVKFVVIFLLALLSELRRLYVNVELKQKLNNASTYNLFVVYSYNFVYFKIQKVCLIFSVDNFHTFFLLVMLALWKFIINNNLCVFFYL